MSGFEGADHRNRFRTGLDMIGATGHSDRLDQDLRRCARMGLRTVRESAGWRLSEIRPGCFDLTRPLAIAAAARRRGVQVLWSLMHYGLPDDLHPFHPDFMPRFVEFAVAVAKGLKPCVDDGHPAVYTPINEIGFLAWAWAETDDFGGRSPLRPCAASSTLESGYVLKLKLVEAALAACKAIREIDPLARFMHVEPVVHVVPPRGLPEWDPLAREVASYQWQVWDLLAGLDEPRLGGDPQWLDILGIDHYHNGQWEVGTERRLHWDLQDPRRKSFASLALATWERYRRPMIVAETSHVGLYRERWFEGALVRGNGRGGGAPEAHGRAARRPVPLPHRRPARLERARALAQQWLVGRGTTRLHPRPRRRAGTAALPPLRDGSAPLAATPA
ncbi:MAG TPA: hypothetical protein VFP68_01840 [Burkholderiaceae bacterium]|nr:hypothetical protein [Burkholderiaceae bacterium]